MQTAEVFELKKFRKKRRTKPPKPRRFGTIKQRGRQWYAKFSYHGVREEVGTSLASTKENRRKLRGLLDRLGEAIRDGQPVRLADVFPNASQSQKERWSRVEGREGWRGPTEITFGEYLDHWVGATLARDPSENKRQDYASIIAWHLRPRWSDHTFQEITGPSVVQFVMDLVTQGLSKSRVSNILIPLRVIYRDACAEYQWVLPDPFLFAAHRVRYGRILPRKRKEPPQPFRFAEWIALIDAMDDWYRPIAEVMVMTGMSASELAGLRKKDVLSQRILVRNKISKGVESDTLKTPYRTRELPVSHALRERLDVLEARAPGRYLVTLPSGRPFQPVAFWKAWTPALEAAGIEHRKPYTTRHTYAVWSLLLGVSPVRLVKLMGHGSKAMIFDVYGDYTEGLEEDIEEIRMYLGEDFG